MSKAALYKTEKLSNYLHDSDRSDKDVMKILLKLGVLFGVLFTISSTFANDFKHFKLKGDLKELNSNTKSFSDHNSLRNQINSKLLNLSPSRSKSVIEDDSPALLRKIAELLGSRYNDIGSSQADSLIQNHDLGGGVLNFSGFTWLKPYANFQLYANRELAPDLFSGRWIVHDTFVLGVDATTLITNLRDSDLIDIDDDGIGAFAGVSFQRVYHYYHFADTYLNGLTADYSKLFLSFTKFNANNIINLDPYEILKKEDKFSFNAGGYVTTPPLYGVSARAGVLVNVAYENELTLQAVGPGDQSQPGEFLRVSVDKKWDIAANAHLSVQLDFFKLLNLTLFSYDLEYSYGKSHKQNLSFYEDDVDKILNSKDHHKEFKKIIKGQKENIDLWKDNIVQLEHRETQNLNSKYNILLLGKIRKKETEQVKVIRNGVEQVFYKHYSQSIKYIQNFLSKLINIVAYRLFDIDTGVKKFAESNKRLKVEYKHTQEIGKEKVTSESDFSLTLTQYFSTGKTHRRIDKKLKSEAVRHIKSWSNLSHIIANKVEDEDLRGPLEFESKIEVEKEGLSYFHSLSEKTAFEIFVNLCRVKIKKKWLDPKKREKSLRRIQLGRAACVKSIGKRYLNYMGEVKNIGDYDINKFRKFIGKYFSKVKNIKQVYNLFGEENVFVHGSLFAKTRNKIPFSTYFKSGNFRGLGVIDNYMRENGTTTPAKLMQ